MRRFNGDPISGVFDRSSYFANLGLYLSFCLTMWFILGKDDKNWTDSMVCSAFYIWGHVFAKPLPNMFDRNAKTRLTIHSKLDAFS